MRTLTTTILALALAALCFPGPASADPLAGATYRGTHSGGGTIELTLSADGRHVDSYVARDVRGDTCQFVAQGDAGEWPGATIDAGTFEYRLYDAILFRGTFPGRLTASGTLRLYNHAVPDGKPACDTGMLSWTATTTASGEPPPVDGGAPPSTSGGIPPAVVPKRRTVSTLVTLKRSRTKVSGRLSAGDRSCLSGRTVTLKRGGKKLRTAKSRADGGFSFKRTAAMRNRSLRAFVSVRSGAAAICNAASSRTIRG
jgi:hypothetical protein